KLEPEPVPTKPKPDPNILLELGYWPDRCLAIDQAIVQPRFHAVVALEKQGHLAVLLRLDIALGIGYLIVGLWKHRAEPHKSVHAAIQPSAPISSDSRQSAASPTIGLEFGEKWMV